MKALKITLKIIFRLLSFPSIIAITCIAAIRLVLFKSYHFLIYDGETITYSKFMNTKTIQEVFEKLDRDITTKEKAIQLANNIGNDVLVDRSTERKINHSNDIGQLVINRSKDL